ncbi:hypothetical protein C0993_008416 [Termitomyces sp. T159_Od127]|nr:hypothetical protein C0993_008416 [Termitomyces sp. T159_Od127]
MFTETFLGGHGIVGAHVPVGAGIAFAQKYMDETQATFVLYGDGASNQGQVEEAFDMAKLWDLPAVFISKNNQYEVRQMRSTKDPIRGLEKYIVSWGLATSANLKSRKSKEVKETVNEAVEEAKTAPEPPEDDLWMYVYDNGEVAPSRRGRERGEHKLGFPNTITTSGSGRYWFDNNVSREFGVFAPVDTPGFGLPGQFGVNFAFINKSTVDVFVDQEKINFFRVTFLMERMCPLSFGLGSRFNETYFAEYADAINYITLTKGAYALLDPHNYMRYNDPSQQPFSGSVIGDSSDPTAATTEQFGEFWAELARRFKTNPKVVFGINNEPHDMPTELVLENNQAAIDGIRSVGAEQLILAPGNGFTGGHSWTQITGNNDAPSSDFMNMLRDPLNNLAIDIHEVRVNLQLNYLRFMTL